MNPQKIIFVVGPTAVGKTDVALKLAKKCNGEIVSCDSMQVYKEISIASNKPSADILDGIKHHLIDIISVEQEFNAAIFNQLAKDAIGAIHKQNKIPIVTGGSGMYMQVLLDGIFGDSAKEGQAGVKDPQRRRELEQRAEEQGCGALHVELERVDPGAAARIHSHDKRRIIRALEVYEGTKKPISQLQGSRRGLWGEYDIAVFALNRERAQLYQRIDQRVEDMLAAGLIDEVKQLDGMRLSPTVEQLIGIKEVKGYLDGDYDLDRAKYLMQRNTRHFAKRQLTWFRKDKRLEWIMIEENDPAQGIVEKIRGASLAHG